MAKDVNDTDIDVIDHNTVLKVFFTNVWNLNVASKIKITCWRIANNYLPTVIFWIRELLPCPSRS